MTTKEQCVLNSSNSMKSTMGGNPSAPGSDRKHVYDIVKHQNDSGVGQIVFIDHLSSVACMLDGIGELTSKKNNKLMQKSNCPFKVVNACASTVMTDKCVILCRVSKDCVTPELVKYNATYCPVHQILKTTSKTRGG